MAAAVVAVVGEERAERMGNPVQALTLTLYWSFNNRHALMQRELFVITIIDLQPRNMQLTVSGYAERYLGYDTDR